MKYIIKQRHSNEVIINDSNIGLNILYKSIFGRALLKIFTSKSFNSVAGIYLNSRLSKHKINSFIKNNNIDINDYEDKKYSSFNDFFIRKIKSNKRKIDNRDNILISPCDSKLTVFRINKDLTLKIKDSYYTIDTLVNNKIIEEYKNGYALIFRLDPTDYHRYCYIDYGYHEKTKHIKGKLHTVQPISLERYNFFKTNTREYTLLHTENFDDVIHIEVGAMIVGKIHNLHDEYNFKKGEEKGYFEFGGSTICLLIKDNIVKIDDDIMKNSSNNIETIVKYGEKIGKRI